MAAVPMPVALWSSIGKKEIWPPGRGSPLKRTVPDTSAYFVRFLGGLQPAARTAKQSASPSPARRTSCFLLANFRAAMLTLYQNPDFGWQVVRGIRVLHGIRRA